MSGADTLAAVAAFVTPAVLGAIVVRALLPVRGRWPALLNASLAVPVGVGICSLAAFAWLVVVGRADGYVAAETIAAGSLAVACWFAARRRRTRATKTGESLPLVEPACRAAGGLILASAVVLVCGVAVYVAKSAEGPHGAWDAWAIWNLRARFLFRAGPDWRDAFHPALDWSHPDYPLLLPTFVTRGWWFVGRDVTLVPVVLHGVMTFALVGTLVSAVGIAAGTRAALLAGAGLVATPGFVAMGASQQADVPLAVFMLGTIAVWVARGAVAEAVAHDARVTSPVARRLSMLAGLLAGLAAWTKNEGLVFILVALVARAVFVRRDTGGRQAAVSAAAGAGAFAIGLVPAAAAIAYLKLALAPPNDVVNAGRLDAALAQLADPSRYAALPGLLWQHLGTFAAPVIVLAVAAVLLRFDRRPRAADPAVRAAAAVVVAMAAAYLLVYVVSPHPLAMHVQTSAERLAYQLWPLVLLVVFAHLRFRPPPAAAPGAIVS